MKQAIAILLFLVVLCQSFSKLLVYADFYMHRDYIAKNLCENRNKPRMHCNGKCHLKKQLAKQDKEDQSQNSREQKEKQELTLFCYENVSPVHGRAIISEKLVQPLFRAAMYVSSYTSSIFHPPSFSC